MNNAKRECSIVAIVGRPNVGKSTLFNRLVGSRQAIVEDRPGVTRDRLYGEADWLGSNFLVVDTGGIDPSLETGMPKHIRIQAEVAVQEADLVLFVVDAVDGLTATDIEIAEYLRSSNRPILLVANKADSDRREMEAADLYSLGFQELHAVSAAHGRGIGDLCDAIVERLPRVSDEPIDAIPEGIRLAFVGRPNAGKSTLVNALLRERRVIVSEEPGTTRDPIALPFRYQDKDLVLIDTAGVRRRRQVARAMEKLAAIKSIRTMERTHVVVMVIDATQGVTDQDQRLARMAFERGKAVVVALTKWDLLREKGGPATQEALLQAKHALAFLEQPLIVKSSVVGDGRDEGQGKAFNLEELLVAALKTSAAWNKRISTSDLNDEMRAAVMAHSPPMHKSQPVRLYFATQTDTAPPFLVISANRARCLVPEYERFLLRRIRRRWGLWGVPVRMVVRGRSKKAGEQPGPAPSRREKGRSRARRQKR